MDIFAKYTQQFVGRVIDEADVYIIYADPNKNVSICNKKIEEITAKRKEEMVGNNLLDLLYHSDSSTRKRQMLKAVMDDSITYKRPKNFEGLILDENNNERLICWSITPILAESKKLEGILLVGNDISELREREASLKKIDETLKNIFASIKEYALFVINLDGNITYYGMGSERLFGWRKNEIIFKHVSTLFREEDTKSSLPLLLEQVGQTDKYETEIELVKKDKSSFPVILSVSQFLDAEGNITGYIFIAKDITERKKLEYQIFQAEKLAAIGQLAAGMAHEINNPLFVISGRTEMLLEQKRMSQKLKQDLDIISAQSDKIRKLVDRVLKFSRQTTPKFEMININDTIEGVLPLLSYHNLPNIKIEIIKDFYENLSSVKGDLNQLQEVFVNLFINAIQAMPQGGRLTVKTQGLENQYVEIKIADTGCGIPPQNLKNIFMPFFSTKKEGTGLGLSICYNIIKNHNGSIDIESQVNKGTVFIIKLPCS